MIFSFIIVNYNTKKITADCIASLYKNSKLQAIDYEIIVVDNNSSDGSKDYLLSRFPDIIYIYNEENLGFGKANNIGSKISKGKFIVLINSDTLVDQTNFSELHRLVEERNDVGFLGCKILNSDNSIQSVGFKFPSLMNEVKLRLLFWNFNTIKKHRFSNYKDKGLVEVDWISGCFMITDREYFEKLDGFDEKIFMYSEDLDICYRMNKLGKKNFVYDYTNIYHLHGQSGNKRTPKLNTLIKRKDNYFYVLKKNGITKFVFLFRIMVYFNVFVVYGVKKISNLARILKQ